MNGMCECVYMCVEDKFVYLYVVKGDIWCFFLQFFILRQCEVYCLDYVGVLLSFLDLVLFFFYFNVGFIGMFGYLVFCDRDIGDLNMDFYFYLVSIVIY